MIIKDIITSHTIYFTDSEADILADKIAKSNDKSLLGLQTLIEDFMDVGDEFDFELATELAEKIREGMQWN